MTQKRPRVIFIDCSPGTRDGIARRLEAQGYEVETAHDAATGAELALGAPPSAVIADLWMPHISGIQICRLLSSEAATSDVPVILRGDADDPKSRFWAQRAGAVAYVTKGAMGELVRALEKAIAAAPTGDGFFMQLGGGMVDIRDRIAEHLDAALFESVIAAEVRALSGAGSFERLFDRLCQLLTQLCGYRWLGLATRMPQRFAVHHHPNLKELAVEEARAALSVPHDVLPVQLEDEDALSVLDTTSQLVWPIEFDGELLGRIAVSVTASRRSEVEGLLPLVAHELSGPLRMAQASDRLQAAADFLSNIYKAMPGALLVFGREGAVEAMNDAAESLLGYGEGELIGRPLAEVFDATEDLRAIQQAGGEGGDVLRSEKTCLAKGGSRIPVLLSATALPSKAQGETGAGVVCVAVDISDRKKLELELRQAQKLESVGRLAAGVAHEINTPVQFVGDNVHFLRDAMVEFAGLIPKYRAVASALRESGAGGELLDELGAAEEAADLDYMLENVPRAIDRSIEGLSRVADIVRSMKAFAHPDTKEMTAVDLNKAIASTLTIARNEYKTVADVATDFGDIPQVRCHVGEVNQAILNIVVNAAHAIGDVVKDTVQRGSIAVKTRTEGEFVLVSISDTGAGIPEAVQTRIFEPFFTTKEVGKGTGQGLAIARSVVRDKHGGDLTFETEPGKGTTFFIRLPIEGKRSAAA
jgi:PAS domain S-box-containing protein